jgi:hypothetical protein
VEVLLGFRQGSSRRLGLTVGRAGSDRGGTAGATDLSVDLVAREVSRLMKRAAHRQVVALADRAASVVLEVRVGA